MVLSVAIVRSSPLGRHADGSGLYLFLVLTAARSSEGRLTTWAEMDTMAHGWTISAMWMKAKRKHRVSLCRRTVEILDAALVHVVQSKVEAVYAGRSCSSAAFGS